MLGRLSYLLRETWASLRRNMTLSVAAIITSAVSLLIFGLTLLMQKGFDNLLVQWEGDVEMIVYVAPDATPEQRAYIESNLENQAGLVDTWNWCDPQCSLDDAKVLLAGDPATLNRLSLENIPTLYKIVPANPGDVEELKTLRATVQQWPKVQSVVLAQDALETISKLKGFVSLYTYTLSVILLFAAILLIWNTIRTAMYARRREIEVMKLVGATDWFIRLPFMLEGLIQGFVGGALGSAGLWIINNRWTAGVKDFPDNSSFTALVVTDTYTTQVMLILIAIGMIAGAIGSGIAASRFLDV